MKVAFTGKGGVGKTTLASLFVRSLSSGGKEVLAVDCDPDSNLARALGFRDHDKITPIVHMEDMINERMGIQKGQKSFFKLNPKIDDIPEKFSKTRENIKLIVMGTVNKGGEGCMCPESTFLKTLLSHLVLKRDEHMVMDMEAGIEHLGRGTAEGCDFVLVVVEPSINSIGTAKNIRSFAKDIGIKKVYAVGNKIRKAADIDFIKKNLEGIKLAGQVSFDEGFPERDKLGPDAPVPEKINSEISDMKKFLEGDLG